MNKQYLLSYWLFILSPEIASGLQKFIICIDEPATEICVYIYKASSSIQTGINCWLNQ